MEHFNPILGSEPNGQKFITCGEIMLRLTPPNYEKIRMASGFEASYGGSEANIALALANLGVDSTFFSVVPNNSLGKSAVRWLRSNDVHCTPMILTEPDETPSNRLGTYYLETGYGIRASKVIYDRKHSAITEYDFSQVDLDALLAVRSDSSCAFAPFQPLDDILLNCRSKIQKVHEGPVNPHDVNAGRNIFCGIGQNLAQESVGLITTLPHEFSGRFVEAVSRCCRELDALLDPNS